MKEAMALSLILNNLPMKNLLLLSAAVSLLTVSVNAQQKIKPFQMASQVASKNQQPSNIQKRSVNEDRPQRIVRSQWNQDSADFLYFKDTTHRAYYTNGLQSSDRVVYPNAVGQFTTYTEFMYNGDGNLIKETYFTVNGDGTKDTSSLTEYDYVNDILVFTRYLSRNSSSTVWEDFEENRFSYELKPGTDLVSRVVKEYRTKDYPTWVKQQRTSFDYQSNGLPKKLKLEFWDSDEEKYMEAGVYDTIIWHKWIKNEHQLEDAEFTMVEGSIFFLGTGRIRLRAQFDKYGNKTQESTYSLHGTDSVMSDATQNIFTYDSKGRALTQLEKYWDSDTEAYLNQSYYEYFDYFTPTALKNLKINLNAAVYPNPAVDQLFVTFSGETKAHLILRELSSGKVLLESDLYSGEGVSIIGLNTGIYTYELQTLEGAQFGKCIKN
jgi:hypothetical protein